MFGMALVAAAIAGPVTLTTADGVTLSGQTWGTGARGVLLVHDEGRTRDDWSSFAPRLANAGMQVLAIDLRGHGASSKVTLTEADWVKLEQDVAAGVKWLGSHGVTELHVVGARLGGSLGLQVAAKNPEVDDLVLLSPAASIHGVKVSTAAAGYSGRPLLVVTTGEDPIGMKTAAFLDGSTTGPHRLVSYPNAGSGAAMLNTVAPLETVLLAWLGGEFDPKAQDRAGLQNAVKTNVNDLETTGTRLEER
jgi:pimeloyl-ACP methyl ester carboxylesterase